MVISDGQFPKKKIKVYICVLCFQGSFENALNMIGAVGHFTFSR